MGYFKQKAIEQMNNKKGKIIKFKLPPFIGNWLDGKIPFFNRYHYGTDYYRHNKTFIIYLD